MIYKDKRKDCYRCTCSNTALISVIRDNDKTWLRCNLCGDTLCGRALEHLEICDASDCTTCSLYQNYAIQNLRFILNRTENASLND